MSISWGWCSKTHLFCRFRETARRRLFWYCKLNCVILGNFTYFGGSHSSWCWVLGSSFNSMHHFFRFTFAGVAVVIMGTASFDDNFRFGLQDCEAFWLVIFRATPMDAVFSNLGLVIWVSGMLCIFLPLFDSRLLFGMSVMLWFCKTELNGFTFKHFYVWVGVKYVNFCRCVNCCFEKIWRFSVQIWY